MTAISSDKTTLPEGTVSAAASDETPVPATVETAPVAIGQRGLTIGVAALAGIALLANIALWQKVSGMQEQLARQSAEAQSQSTQAHTLSKEAVALVQETAARVALQEARLGELGLQRTQLEELMQSLSRSRDENLVVDIEAALRLAEQQAQLTGSVAPLLAALKSADQRISRAAQPRLATLQRAIVRDIERVKSSVVSDTPAMLVKLDELVRLADQLVVGNAVKAAHADATRAAPSSAGTDTWWRKAWQLVLNESRDLVRVSRVETPEAALLSPEQSFFLRENFKLRLLNARLGLLARQFESAQADLAVSEVTLGKYFDAESPKTQTALALLQQLQGQMRTLQLPRLDDTLAVLATAAAGR